MALVYALSFLSGAAALIYEVEWFQMLELVTGSTAQAIAYVLAGFMGGLCLGSLAAPNAVRRFSTRSVYAVAELGIGVLAFAMLAIGMRTEWAAVLLIAPATLMGATLPTLAATGARVAWLYGLNALGAVGGSLLASFYLLRFFDVTVTTYFAAALNAICFIGAFAIPRSAAAETSDTATDIPYIAITLSGFCAMAAEVVWTRNLGLVFGASVYTFSIVLAVFLVGLAIGSALASRLDRRALGWSQALAAMGILLAAFGVSKWSSLAAILPATICWGAALPLAAGEGIGLARAYVANTLGSIVGAILASLLLIPTFGTKGTQQLLILVSLAAATSAFSRRAFPALAALSLLVFAVPDIADVVLAHGRFAASWVDKGDIIYAAEGKNSAIAVSRFANGTQTFHVAGKIQASSAPRDMRLQRMLGHLTTLLNRTPKSILVIGCGAGITAGAVSVDPRVERETIAEIEPLVPRAAAKYFADQNQEVVRNPKVRIVYDDGRHFLLNAQDKFDGITIDPLDPWVKGAANLYTKEFYEAMRAHLNPGGVVTMYIQLFETTEDAVKTSLATFFEVFPTGTVWGNPYDGRGHDMVLAGTLEPTSIDLDRMQEMFRSAEFDEVNQSMTEVGIYSYVDLFATYAGRAADLAPWTAGAAINRDKNLRMQYLAGMGLNLDDSDAIYKGLIKYRQYPANMFRSAEGRDQSIRLKLQAEVQP